MDPVKLFEEERIKRIGEQAENAELKDAGDNFMTKSIHSRYSYNFSWLGRPIIQYPQDMIAMQEIIWNLKPDLIIETGVAHGGSLIFYASILELIGKEGTVLGIDIDIRKHNRMAIESHPMFRRIKLIEGSSVDFAIIQEVNKIACDKKCILICLDSNHTHEHVLAELNAYASLTTVGSYCVVFDTIVEDLPEQDFSDRPWDVGNNPKTAVWEFLKSHPEFEIDKIVQDKLLITVAPDGYLKRIK